MFAYGSNMHLPDLARWHRDKGLQAPRVLSARVAVLGDHELCWNYYSRVRGAGAANVRPAAGREVMGLALTVDDDTFENLDRKEGAPHVYERVRCTVRVDQTSLPAWVYQVTAAWRRAEFVPPRRSYRQLMLDAACEHGFGEAYLQQLLGVRVAD